eukprot:scaffold5020_cov258-Pinguiococcus_pyrenoidosus.AAC.8
MRQVRFPKITLCGLTYQFLRRGGSQLLKTNSAYTRRTIGFSSARRLASFIRGLAASTSWCMALDDLLHAWTPKGSQLALSVASLDDLRRLLRVVVGELTCARIEVRGAPILGDSQLPLVWGIWKIFGTEQSGSLPRRLLCPQVDVVPALVRSIPPFGPALANGLANGLHSLHGAVQALNCIGSCVLGLVLNLIPEQQVPSLLRVCTARGLQIQALANPVHKLAFSGLQKQRRWSHLGRGTIDQLLCCPRVDKRRRNFRLKAFPFNVALQILFGEL